MLFDLANLPYWIFLGMGVLLFLLVIVSGGGEDSLDTDADLDVDVGADIDTNVSPWDIDTNTDANGELSFGQILGWLGIGKVPIILLLATDFSILGVTGWILNVILGGITGTIPTGFFAGAVSGVSLLISLFVGGLISQPLGKVFASFGEDATGERLIGCHGTVCSSLIPPEGQSKIGQVDVLDLARNLVTINANLPSWAKVIPARGSQVLVIDKQDNSYLVVAKDSSDEQEWLANLPRRDN